MNSTEWVMNPAKSIGLDQDILDKLELKISTAYIGMVRIYHKNRTVFQTCSFTPILNAAYGVSLDPDYKSLAAQTKSYIDKLINSSQDERSSLLNTHYSLF